MSYNFYFSYKIWWWLMGSPSYPKAQRLLSGSGDRSLPFSAGHQQMEQDRTPLVLLHKPELARQAADQPRVDYQPHRRYCFKNRLGREKRTRLKCVSGSRFPTTKHLAPQVYTPVGSIVKKVTRESARITRKITSGERQIDRRGTHSIDSYMRLRALQRS